MPDYFHALTGSGFIAQLSERVAVTRETLEESFDLPSGHQHETFFYLLRQVGEIAAVPVAASNLLVPEHELQVACAQARRSRTHFSFFPCLRSSRDMFLVLQRSNSQLIMWTTGFSEMFQDLEGALRSSQTATARDTVFGIYETSGALTPRCPDVRLH